MQKYQEEERWQKAEADRLVREEQIRKDTVKQQKRREKGTYYILHYRILYLEYFGSLTEVITNQMHLFFKFCF